MSGSEAHGRDLLRNVVAFVLCGGRGERLDPLTRDRSKPAVPFGGTYRIVDFTLSNCINSGLRKICLLTQYKSHSLSRHVKQGWSLFAAELEEFIETIPPQLRVSSHWYLGTADAIYQNFYTLDQEMPELVLVLSGDHVYRMDYRSIIETHRRNKADITLGVVSTPVAEASRFGVVETEADGRVKKFREKPKDLAAGGPDVHANMGVYLFRADTLREILSRDAAKPGSTRDFGHDVLPDAVALGLRVYAHEFRPPGENPSPYWRDIGTLDAYFEANMDLVAVTPEFSLYDDSWPIRSAAIQSPPAKFVFANADEDRLGEAHDSLVSAGVIVSGGHVERSIVGPGCRVRSWASVTDSILFGDTEVGRHAVVRRAIVDKGVRIPEGAEVGVNAKDDSQRFRVTESGIVVVPRGAVL